MDTTEHEYIQHLIEARWWGDTERLAHPLQDKHKQHLLNGEAQEALAMEILVGRLAQQLWNEKERHLDILKWLRQDSALRLEGITYPDCYEIGKGCE